MNLENHTPLPDEAAEFLAFRAVLEDLRETDRISLELLKRIVESVVERPCSESELAAEVVTNLGTNVPTPATESQARPLTRLEPEVQREVWKEVLAETIDRRERLLAEQALKVAPSGFFTADEIRLIQAAIREGRP